MNLQVHACPLSFMYFSPYALSIFMHYPFLCFIHFYALSIFMHYPFLVLGSLSNLSSHDSEMLHPATATARWHCLTNVAQGFKELCVE